MRELEVEFSRYANLHAYKATRLHNDETDERHWKWQLVITEQPDPALAIMIGDVLGNWRSSLDHIAAALAPKWERPEFPLEADIKRRKSFETAASHFPTKAAAYIERLQPYRVAPLSRDGNPQVHSLLVLNRLVQADKHKKLIPIVTSLDRVRSFVVYETIVQSGHGSRRGGGEWFRDFCDEGAVVADFTHGPGHIPAAHKVHVQLSGTPRVAVKVVEGYGNNDLLKMIRDTIVFVRDKVFPALERHIPR